MKLLPHLSLLLLSLSATRAKKFLSLSNLWIQARRVANLSHTFGSPHVTAQTPYERIASHPVFQVTTSWGAPYMNFEKVDRANDDAKVGAGQETRPVTLFYMDPEDAVQMHEEMKQMDHMSKSDIRITATTLAKAIRQAANFGDGLPTGSPIDPLTGKLKSASEGGSLRYKIVPSKRPILCSKVQGKRAGGVVWSFPNGRCIASLGRKRGNKRCQPGSSNQQVLAKDTIPAKGGSYGGVHWNSSLFRARNASKISDS